MIRTKSTQTNHVNNMFEEDKMPKSKKQSKQDIEDKKSLSPRREHLGKVWKGNKL